MGSNKQQALFVILCLPIVSSILIIFHAFGVRVKKSKTNDKKIDISIDTTGKHIV